MIKNTEVLLFLRTQMVSVGKDILLLTYKPKW